MRKLSPDWALPAAMILLAACGGGRLKTGRYYDRGTVVEAKGADLAQAKRAAVGSVLNLFLSPEALKLSESRIEKDVLSRPDDFMSRVESARTESGETLLKALVDYAGIRKALAVLIQADLFGGGMPVRVSFPDSDGATRPCGPGGHPDEAEDCPPAGVPAAAALREVLAARGFAVSDGGGEGARGHDGTPPLPAQIVLQGRSAVYRLSDDRLNKYHPTRALLSVRATTVPPCDPNGHPDGAEDCPPAGVLQAETLSFDQEASALDLSAEGAKAKAIANAAERVGARVAARWARGRQIVIMVAGLKDFSEARELVAALRGAPGVAGASLDSHQEYATRLTVSSSRGEEELVRWVKELKKPPLRTFAVRPGYLEVEVDR